MKSNAGHLQINIHKENVAFYKDLFLFLGWTVIYDEPNMVGVVDSHGVSFWFGEGLKTTANDYDGIGTNHIAMAVPAQADVDEAVAYLKDHQVTSLFETPRHRPEFCSDPKITYYQVMFESPDRILFEVVYTGLISK
jgi:catechol 2,3-dioxygenase-like lactoylglutathione lyase family enzyme